MKKLDCKKITTVEEIALILELFGVYIDESCEYYEKLKHLIDE